MYCSQIKISVSVTKFVTYNLVNYEEKQEALFLFLFFHLFLLVGG